MAEHSVNACEVLVIWCYRIVVVVLVVVIVGVMTISRELQQ